MIGPYELADGTLRALHMVFGLVLLAVGVIGGWWTRRGTMRDD